jgi:gliding motility-associated lipoprotein GldD
MSNLSKCNAQVILPVFFLCSILSCKEVNVPKPKGFIRIDLPAKDYLTFNETGKESDLPLKFEYPSYGSISYDEESITDPGWFNIVFPAYKARIYLTYKDVADDLENLIEQTYVMNVKNHIIKADAINEQLICDSENRIYGLLYDLKGNTASAVQFYVTDSTEHYLRGSLYFESEPDADSLSPVIEFFREDVIHLIETLKWKEK